MSRRTLIRGGSVLTLGQRTSNHIQADVLIDGDRIAEVGPGLRARDAEVVEAGESIVMPGFVDAHRHVWKSLFRNLGLIGSDGGAVLGSSDLGRHFAPDDVYAGTLIGLLGAVEAGITTVVDWCDVAFGAEYDEAVLQAHADAGLRTVVVRGAPRWEDGSPVEAALEMAQADRVTSDPLRSVALGASDPRPADQERSAEEWRRAREAGIRIHAHVGTSEDHRGVVADLGGRDLLAGDVTLVHCTRLSDEDLDAVASAGASVVLTPPTEMANGIGTPPMQQLIDRSIRPGLGVDDERIAPGDVFAQMRAAISVQHALLFDLKLAGKGGVPNLMSTRDVIRHGTSDGARAAGLEGLTGSIEPGMQADVIVLRADRSNIFPINDPIGAVVWGMDTSNLDWAFVAGRALVSEGELVADTSDARETARKAHERVAAAAGLVVGAGSVRSA